MKKKEYWFIVEMADVWRPIERVELHHLIDTAPDDLDFESRGPFKDRTEAIMEADKRNGICQGCFHNPCVCKPDDWPCDAE